MPKTECSYCDWQGSVKNYKDHLNENHYKCWFCETVVGWQNKTSVGCINCHDEVKDLLENKHINIFLEETTNEQN